MSGDLCVAIWLCRFPGCAKHASGMRRAWAIRWVRECAGCRAVSRFLPSHRGPAEVVSPGEKNTKTPCLRSVPIARPLSCDRVSPLNRGNRWDQARGEFQSVTEFSVLPRLSIRRKRRWSRPSRPFSSMCCCRGPARLQTRPRSPVNASRPPCCARFSSRSPMPGSLPAPRLRRNAAHSTSQYLTHRLAAAVNFEQEAIRAHQNFV